jgi:hypothetical protein
VVEELGRLLAMPLRIASMHVVLTWLVRVVVNANRRCVTCLVDVAQDYGVVNDRRRSAADSPTGRYKRGFPKEGERGCLGSGHMSHLIGPS